MKYQHKNIRMKIKAQSFIDYAALIAVISISLMAMWGYVLKSVNARIYHVKADLNSPINGIR
ncbi:MAG: hypothetical protein PHE97_04175 [Candidatus Omnitrophica bacterium]|nr:hypothetical protein [Candidatus Omnitrophota bacterium]